MLDTLLGSIADVGLGFAGLGIDDAGGVNAGLEDCIDFGLRGAIEAGAKGGEEADYLGVRVAFYSWEIIRRKRARRKCLNVCSP